MKPGREEALTFLGVLAILALAAWGPWADRWSATSWDLRQTALRWMGGRWATSAPSADPDPILRALLAENARLHSLLALQERLPGTVHAVPVLRREPDTWWSELVVARPQAAKLPQGPALVLTAQGVIGLWDEGAGEATGLLRIRLLSAPGQQTSVTVGEGEAPFLLEGRGSASFGLRPVTSESERSLRPGESVQTSGLGQVFSLGLPVATVDRDVRWADFSACPSTPAEVLLWWR